MVAARISLVTLGVTDVDRSRAFYRALGWEAGVDMDGFAVFRTAGRARLGGRAQPRLAARGRRLAAPAVTSGTIEA